MLKELKVQQDQQVLQVHRVILDILEHRVRRGQEVQVEQQELKEPKDQQDQQVQQVLKVIQDILEHRVRRGQ